MRRALRFIPILLCATRLGAQGVVIAPHAVFIDGRARSGSVLLYNPNTPPLERQTIRLLASPPPGLPTGEYWARLVVAAKGGQLPVTGVADTAAVKVGLTLEVRTIIGVYYRQGAVGTGVAISGLRTALAGDSLVVWSRLQQQGNAAYIGTVQGWLADSTGATRGEFKAPIGVYYTMEPRYAMRIGALPAGRYWLKLKLTTEREDLGPEVVLRSTVTRDSVQVRIP